MNTWTSRIGATLLRSWSNLRVLFALALAFALSACAEGGASFFGSSDQGTRAEPSRPNTALLSAEMAKGAIKLVPPDGFCIDRRGLRQNFAVLARCDSLGGRGGAQDAPLGLISVAITDAPDPVDVQALLAGVVRPGTDVLKAQADGEFAVLHLQGVTPDGTDPRHWRGLTQIGSHLVGLSGYGPRDSPFAASDGARLMSVLAQRTQDASVALDVARKTSPETDGQQKGLGALISGLFE